MYCQVCQEIVSEEDTLIDKDGWHWGWDMQLCKDHRKAKEMTEKEIFDQIKRLPKEKLK